jgi:hypothetical protein
MDHGGDRRGAGGGGVMTRYGDDPHVLGDDPVVLGQFALERAVVGRDDRDTRARAVQRADQRGNVETIGTGQVLSAVAQSRTS